MKKTLKVVLCTLLVQLVLGGGATYWVLSTPDDAMATVEVSRDWIARLGAQRAAEQQKELQMLQEMERMQSTLELLLGNGARRV